MQPISLTYKELEVSINDFETSFRLSATEQSIIDDLNEVIAKGEEIVDARGLILEFDDVLVDKGCFKIHDTVFNCKGKIAKQLKKAESLALFVCTAGDGITRQYKEYMQQNEPLKAYFADLLGSISVEKAMDILQNQFREKKEKEGLSISNRYSPGYCG